MWIDVPHHPAADELSGIDWEQGLALSDLVVPGTLASVHSYY
jgi:hypothetical protein